MLNPMQSAPRMGYKPEDSLITKIFAHSGNFLLDCVDLGLFRAASNVKYDLVIRYEDSKFYDLNLLETATKSSEIEVNSIDNYLSYCSKS